ncbi:MAG: hypothetical protein AAB623_01240 [Patescibacteria group bacterium]
MKKINIITSLGLIIAMFMILVGPFAQTAYAATITTASDTLSTVAPSVVANHTILFGSPTGIAGGGTVTITFPAGFNMGTVAFGDIDFATGSTSTCSSATYTEQTLAATAATTTWGAAVSGQVLTITSGTGTSTAGNCLRLKIGTNTTGGTNQITNPTAASYGITIGGTFGDTGTITVNIVANTVSVSGTVGQSISFSLGATSLALGTLSSSAVVSGSHTFTVATNAASGMAVTVTGTTLTSGSNTIAACATGCTSTAGTAQFGINLVANTTPAVGAAASGSAPIGVAATGYATANNFRFVTGETIASSTAGINSSVFTVAYITNIAGATAAGSYTTTLTYTATATF